MVKKSSNRFENMRKDLLIGMVGSFATGVVFLVADAVTNIINKQHNLGCRFDWVRVSLLAALMSGLILYVVRMKEKK